jgi:hypothetical protein
MGINSTEVSYHFGQLGSVYTTAASNVIKPPTGKVFVAITMLDDTIFEDTGGLVAETRVNGSVTNNIYAGTEAAAHNLTASSETVDEGSGGVIVGGTTESDAVTFPVGVTIYGRYTQIDVYSGAVIAYIGE